MPSRAKAIYLKSSRKISLVNQINIYFLILLMFHKSEISLNLSQYYNSLKFGSMWKSPIAKYEPLHQGQRPGMAQLTQERQRKPQDVHK